MPEGPKQKRVWLEWNDVAHVLLFNLTLIVASYFYLAWQVALLLMGWSFWDLGWHQRQHHRDRAHIHVPLRLVGAVLVLSGGHELHVLLQRLN